MPVNDLVGLIITILLGLVVVIIALVLLTGRGSFLIAGFNTLPEEEKEKFDRQALCRFMGKITLPIGVLMPLVAIGGILQVAWLSVLYALIVVSLTIFAIVYSNTGHRFRK
ncbi:MAG: DUF3784 domain-containing protein [Peptococcaceae bacterium]|nr:DUF3784 domain-containing protein [Peptococcaceae bacterium]